MSTFTGLKSLVRLRVETEKKNEKKNSLSYVTWSQLFNYIYKYETSPILDQFWLNKSKRQIKCSSSSSVHLVISHTHTDAQ